MRLLHDPLLAAARLLANVGIAICGLVLAAIAIGLPIALLNQQRILDALTRNGDTVVHPDFFLALSAVLLVLAVLMGATVWFLLLLRQIIATVGQGDPFISDNADRLARMGWIALAVQGLEVALYWALRWVAPLVEDGDSVRLDDDASISGSAIVMVLVLFILARVFRQGAAMREDLEGTV
jgi:hypothetical protein